MGTEGWVQCVSRIFLKPEVCTNPNCVALPNMQCILNCSIRNGGFFNFHFFAEGRFQFFNIRRIRANCIMADLVHFLRTFNGIVPLFWETDSLGPNCVFRLNGPQKRRERNASYRTFPTQFDRAASQSKSDSHKNKIAWGSPRCC